MIYWSFLKILLENIFQLIYTFLIESLNKHSVLAIQLNLYLLIINRSQNKSFIFDSLTFFSWKNIKYKS